jgi:ketosteroid isomerase-like protein
MASSTGLTVRGDRRWATTVAIARIVAAMPDHEKRIEIAKQLFAAWSSGDADAPEAYLTPDAVLNDVASGRFEGWPAIRAFFSQGLAKWDDLELLPDEFWVNEDGLALHYVMSATIKDPDRFGPEFVGKKWSVEVMSLLRFDGDRVCYEGDFHAPGARNRSLGLA